LGAAPGRRQRAGRLDEELERLRRIPLLVCDEVGYVPFAPEAAALVSSRYEQASMIVSSNKPFSAWAEIFGDAVAVMVDRRVHHAEIVSLNGDSCRLEDRRKGGQYRLTSIPGRWAEFASSAVDSRGVSQMPWSWRWRPAIRTLAQRIFLN
jgi:hypothetical protein